MRNFFARVFSWFVTQQTHATRQAREQSDRQIWDSVTRGSDDPDARRVQDQSARAFYEQRRQRGGWGL